MPVITNTYTPSDLLDWVEDSNTLGWTNDGSHTVTTPGGNGTLKVEGNGSYSGGNSADYTDGTFGSGAVVYLGELDISDIPLDAIIQQIVIRAIATGIGECESDASGASTRSGGGACSIALSVNANVNGTFFIGNESGSVLIIFGISNTDNQSDTASTPPDGISAGDTATDSDSDAIDFTTNDFQNMSMTRAAFIAANHHVISVSGSANGNINCSVQFTGTNSSETAVGTGAVAATLELTDWEFDITFFTEDTDVPLVEETQDGGYELGGVIDADDVVIIVDISGIYILVPGKRDDSWYDREGAPGATIDVKIPDPFVSFGFLPEDN